VGPCTIDRAILTASGKKYTARECWMLINMADIKCVFKYLTCSKGLAPDLP